MKILNGPVSENIIFLIICVALMVTFIGSAAASSEATQEHSGEVSVNDGVVRYSLDQQQSAEITNGDGEINQAQMSSGEVFYNSHSGVTMVTMRDSQVQNVDTSSTGDSSNDIGSTENEVKTFSTDSNANIYSSQEQTEQSSGENQEQTGFLKIIDTPGDRIIGIVHLQQK